MRVRAPVTIPMVQIEGRVAQKLVIVDCKVEADGTSLFWIHSLIDKAVARTRTCKEVEVTFVATGDPMVMQGECRFTELQNASK